MGEVLAVIPVEGKGSLHHGLVAGWVEILIKILRREVTFPILFYSPVVVGGDY